MRFSRSKKYIHEQANGVFWVFQSNWIELTLPINPHTKKASENTTRRNDQISLHCRSIRNNETSITFLQNNAGKSKVNGTDVKLPIKATKSFEQSIDSGKECLVFEWITRVRC